MSNSHDRMTEDLTSARKNLSDALGSKMKTYLKLIRSWLKKKISMEDFDVEARSLLTQDCVHLHNFFLIALMSKCQASNSSSKLCHTEDETILKRKKPRNKTFLPTATMDSGTFRKFLPADPLCQAPQTRIQTYNSSASMPEYVSSDFFLPTTSLIHGRMLVSSWEHDLDGVHDDCVQLMVFASEIFLKNILMAVACHKNPFALRRRKFRYAVGSQRIPSNLTSGGGHGGLDLDELGLSTDFTEEGFIPSLKPTPSLAEQEAAVRLSGAACGPSVAGTHHVTLFDLLEVVQTQKSVIPCHTISTLLMERIINMMTHPTREEEEEESKMASKMASRVGS